MQHSDGREGVIWHLAEIQRNTLSVSRVSRQDFAAEAVKVTYFSNDLLSSETHRLVGLASQLLIGLSSKVRLHLSHQERRVEMAWCSCLVDLRCWEPQTCDMAWHLLSRPSSKDGTVEAELVKFTATGEEILRKALPTQKDLRGIKVQRDFNRNDSNLYEFEESSL